MTENLKSKSKTSRLKGQRVYDGQKNAKLGTPKRPAVVTVQTEARFEEVSAIFRERGWSHQIELDAKQPEDTTDLNILLHKQDPIVAEKKIGRNDPCVCGSGKKSKKCCNK